MTRLPRKPYLGHGAIQRDNAQKSQEQAEKRKAKKATRFFLPIAAKPIEEKEEKQ